MSAVYEEDGRLRLEHPLPLPKEARVMVTVLADESDEERELWLKASAKALTNGWETSEDDVFNELLEE